MIMILLHLLLLGGVYLAIMGTPTLVTLVLLSRAVGLSKVSLLDTMPLISTTCSTPVIYSTSYRFL